jgi:hypothetical protein
MNQMPRIVTPGPPPERHAARVVAEMCHWLFEREQESRALVREVAGSSRSNLGTPRAQLKHFRRIGDAGGRLIVELDVLPAKRGKFKARILSWAVFDPVTNRTSHRNDEFVLPERPWLLLTWCFWDHGTKEKGRVYRMFCLTHHAMVRLAERCEMRSPNDLIDSVEVIWRGLRAQFKSAFGDAKADVIYVPVMDKFGIKVGTAVIERTEQYGHIVKTILDANMTV